MCGITIQWAKRIDAAQHKKALAALGPRGPDVSTQDILVHGSSSSQTEIAIGFARLHIQGSKSGAEQPFRSADGQRYVVCNGEIFNSEILIKQLGLIVPEGASDCAVIPALLDRGMSLANTCRELDGDFAIVVVDLAADTIQVARDPYGVRPMFWLGDGESNALASEIKGLPLPLPLSGSRAESKQEQARIEVIQPGSVRTYSISDGSILGDTQWHQVPWLKTPYWRSSLEGLTHGGLALKHALEEAVAKRLTTVRSTPGACLSGGLDSSLVAAIAAKKLAKSGKRLHTYSIGMEGSPDLEHARLVAAHIGSDHHERIVTAAECLAVIPEVIRAIESFDITTVRASVGNYLVGRLVTEKTPEVKVVLNGDGADEVLGGYLYMRAAPDDAAFESELDRLLREIHQYDVLRSERSMAAHSLESRSPFLDRQFISVARGLPTDALRPTKSMMEKAILRTAFADSGLLPPAVLWRRKEAFSDGISRASQSWFEMAAAEGERRAVTSGTYVVNPPPTAEARWYRELFHESYPAAAASAAAPAMWMPRFVNATDPSARTLALYSSTE